MFQSAFGVESPSKSKKEKETLRPIGQSLLKEEALYKIRINKRTRLVEKEGDYKKGSREREREREKGKMK